MDAIKHACEKLGGKVWVESVVGQGTVLFLEVPYITEFKKDSSSVPAAA